MFSIPPTVSKPKPQLYTDQQRMYNMFNRENDEAFKLQFKPAMIRNSKDLYDLLFSSHRENANNNRHQFYLMQQDATNADVGLD